MDDDVDHEWCQQVAPAGDHGGTRLQRRRRPVLLGEAGAPCLVEAGGDPGRGLQGLAGGAQYCIHPQRGEIVHDDGDHEGEGKAVMRARIW